MRRVVVTGLGVVAPNGLGCDAYGKALQDGRSGLQLYPPMAEHGFGCHVAGIPPDVDELLPQLFSSEEMLGMNSIMHYASIAALEAWKDAGLTRPARDSLDADSDSGAVIGTGAGGIETVASHLVPMTNGRRVRRLGSTIVEKFMASGVSACVGGLLALGNRVSSNSSACTTGTEAVIVAAERIRAGLAVRMLAGGAEGTSPYPWAGFDSMRLLNRRSNDQPEAASRPLSASAAGFIPAAGAGILLLESLESARERGARIHAEVLGGAVNCGGQRHGGSITAPNPLGVQRCIRAALKAAEVECGHVDAINGHLTGTIADPWEVQNWAAALGCAPDALPRLQATKSLIGHGMGAAGALECVAVVLQLAGRFLHGSPNCEDLHADLAPFARSVVHETCAAPGLRIFAKASFGFGDVNGCVLFRRWDEDLA